MTVLLLYALVKNFEAIKLVLPCAPGIRVLFIISLCSSQYGNMTNEYDQFLIWHVACAPWHCKHYIVMLLWLSNLFNHHFTLIKPFSPFGEQDYISFTSLDGALGIINIIQMFEGLPSQLSGTTNPSINAKYHLPSMCKHFLYNTSINEVYFIHFYLLYTLFLTLTLPPDFVVLSHWGKSMIIYSIGQ